MNFDKELEKLNINLTPEMAKRFDVYYETLVDVNRYMNLTAITEYDDVYIKHFLDSLSINLAYSFDKKTTLCDVGSGAGFPSIPLAIVNNDVEVTIIDALNKRIKFLNDLSLKLGLPNVKAYHKRAEEFAKEKREYFDVVTARAVARLNVLAELCLPLVKIGGFFIAMKGQSALDEIDEAKRAIEILGGKINRIIKFDLPCEAGHREIIVIEKIKATGTKYPRAFTKIKERPL